jgi:aminopeptidase N
VAHELAHQWFGNLVTMEWWKELWLNEGFATFIGNQAVDVLFPEWQIWTNFVSTYLFNALRLDALLSSHPIEVEVHRSREIDEIFDAISYSKGASVIRMLATYLGEAKFQKGLQIYLKRHQYSNATTQDLWQALGESSGVNVASMMHHWTASIGYPVVSVERKHGKHLHVHQERFLSSGRPTAEQDTTVWHLQLPVVGEHHGEPSFFEVKEKDQTIDLPDALHNGWLKANAGQSSVLRVKYSQELLDGLNLAIQNLKLSATDRLGVVADAFALSKAGQIPLSQALSISRAFVNETDYSVWSDLSGNLAMIAALWEAEASFPKLQTFVRNLYSKIGHSLGWEQKAGQSDLDKLLRAVVISRLADSGDQATVDEALKRYATFQQDPKSLAADLRAVVFKLVMRHGGEKEFNEMITLYKSAQMPEEKLSALRGVGYSNKRELIQRGLDYILGGEVRKQDLFYLVAACSSTPQGRDLTWAWIKQNWSARLVPEFSGGMGLLSSVIKYGLDGYANNEIANEVEAFFKANGTDDTKRTVAQVVENIRANAAWLARNRDDVTQFLSQQ